MGDYFVLDGKKPSTKHKETGLTREDVESFQSVGMYVKPPFVVFDFDNEADAEAIIEIVADTDLSCKLMRTTRGVHLWLKSDEPISNRVGVRSALGIRYDVRSHGKISYVKVKENGKWREWLKDDPVETISEIPDWLQEVAVPKDKFDFRVLGEGDGRNQSLFSYIAYLQMKGFSKESVEEIIAMINEYVLVDRLEDSELSVILRDDAFLSEEALADMVSQSFYGEKGKLLSNEIANYLITKHHIVYRNSNYYLYKDGVYCSATTDVEALIIKTIPETTIRTRREILDYIRIESNIRSKLLPPHDGRLCLLNGRLDLMSGDLAPHSPDAMDFVQLPVYYNPSAHCAAVDHVLDKVFLGDAELKQLFEEMVGYTLLPHCNHRKGFILTGGGANGKSTILNMIKAFLGQQNIASIDLHKLEEPFFTAELENKLANIGDDISRSRIEDTGIIKKLFTGESVLVHRKHQQPFELIPRAKMMFSANNLPSLNDQSYGIFSRLVIIPFRATFRVTDSDYDPRVGEKLCTPEALSYLLNLAIRGARRLEENKGFTETTLVSREVEQLRIDNSSILTWADDTGITREDFIGENIQAMFSSYKDWCSTVSQRTVSIQAFVRECKTEYQIGTKRVNIQEGKKRTKLTIFTADCDES